MRNLLFIFILFLFFGCGGSDSAPDFPELNTPISLTQNKSMKIDTGNSHAVAIKLNGSLWTWGLNSKGQIGDGIKTTSEAIYYQPKKIGEDFIAVAAGEINTYGIKTDGSLWAWGNNEFGQIGDGTTEESLIPKQIGSGFKIVAARTYRVYAIKTDGSLWAWGYNRDGGIGNGATSEKILSPVQIYGNWKDVAPGVGQTIAIKEDNSLWGWGRNDSCELGLGYSSGDNATEVEHTEPVKIGEGYSLVAAGSQYSIALKPDGSLWSWGHVNGTLYKIPTQFGSNFVSIAGGYYNAILLKDDGDLFEWDEKIKKIGTKFTSIAPMHYKAIGIRSDSSLWSWSWYYSVTPKLIGTGY